MRRGDDLARRLLEFAAAVLRLQDAMRGSGALVPGNVPATRLPAREVRFNNLSFAYPSTSETVLQY